MGEEDYTVQGFKASAVAAGLKKKGGLDLALIVSEKEATAAGVFTTNLVKAAPVLLSIEHLETGLARAIIANSGNANACTGADGLGRARQTAELVATELGIQTREVLVASTGVIGLPLDMGPISRSIPQLLRSLSAGGMPLAAEAIMTTDSFPKMSRYHGRADGVPYRIVGLAKGAGMIMPQMATMLCFVMSDIRLSKQSLRTAVAGAVERTFNRISVDGDTSTNDAVLALANGGAGNGPISSSDYEAFEKGLALVMDDLALMIVRDGEGATKVVHVKVKGAATAGDALAAARTIANSSLVKTACYGQDPNWGRIMAALGRSGIRMQEQNVSICIDEAKIVEAGLGTGPQQERRAAETMRRREFSLVVDLGQGEHEDRITTCDLTHEYVSINADYRT
jgi:glutamate N-acetyltransferase/amino-acid N-acetyltransferase